MMLTLRECSFDPSFFGDPLWLFQPRKKSPSKRRHKVVEIADSDESDGPQDAMDDEEQGHDDEWDFVCVINEQ